MMEIKLGLKKQKTNNKQPSPPKTNKQAIQYTFNRNERRLFAFSL